MNDVSAVLGRAFALIMGAFALGLVANADAKKIDAATLDSIQRVGVVSVAGDTLICRRFGITAFGNKEEVFDVSDWNLDAAWQDQLEEALAMIGEFQVVPLSPEDRARLIASIEDERNAGQRVADAAKAIAEAEGVDAILFFASPATDLYSRELYLEKYGIFKYKAAFKKTAIYYLSGRLYLLDAAGKTLDTQYLPGERPKTLGPIPHVMAPKELIETWFSDYTPEQKEDLRNALIDLPRALWTPALTKLLETK